MTEALDSHIFTIRFEIAGAGEDDGHAERAYEDDRLDDVLLGVPMDNDGIFEADFTRTAPTFAAAVLAAIEDLQGVFPEAELIQVDPDALTTISGIAERMGRSHESIRLLVQGKRGPGGFPKTASTPGTKPQVWRWHEVVDWFEKEMGVPVPAAENAKFLAMLNDILRLRIAAPRVIDNRRTASAMAALLPKELVA
jgi:hypothetical protein